MRVVTAPEGAQDATRHAQCFYIGGLVARGDLGYEEAYEALLKAALRHAGPSRGDPWRNLEERVARSLESGMARPLALSETEHWVRDFRARMRLKRPQERVMADEREATAAAARALNGTAEGADGADANSRSATAGVGGIDWDALVAATTENSGAPFAPDVIRELAALKRRTAFNSRHCGPS